VAPRAEEVALGVLTGTFDTGTNEYSLIPGGRTLPFGISHRVTQCRTRWSKFDNVSLTEFPNLFAMATRSRLVIFGSVVTPIALYFGASMTMDHFERQGWRFFNTGKDITTSLGLLSKALHLKDGNQGLLAPVAPSAMKDGLGCVPNLLSELAGQVRGNPPGETNENYPVPIRQCSFKDGEEAEHIQFSAFVLP